MRTLIISEVMSISGGMDISNLSESTNVIDCREGWYCTNLDDGSINFGQTWSIWVDWAAHWI